VLPFVESQCVDILLADDDPEVRSVLAKAFRKAGSRITEARSGYDLFDQLRERARSKAGFDLIISDIRMPGFTGLKVLEVLRATCDGRHEYEPQIHDTPIILITAFGDQDVQADADRLGAALFHKPFDIDELQAYALKLVRPVDELYREYGGEE
jgi:CheY-like chemotaxis protein